MRRRVTIISLAGCFLGLGTLLTSMACDSAQRTPYSVEVDDARALSPRASVFVIGVKVGQVRNVRLNEAKNKAIIEFVLDKVRSPELRADSCVKISLGGATGEMRLDVTPGTSGQLLTPGDRIDCVEENEMLEQFERTAESMTSLVESLIKGDGLVSRLIRDESLVTKLEDFLNHRCQCPGTAPPATASESPSKIPSKTPSKAPSGGEG